MTNWIVDKTSLSRPYFASLADQIAQAIELGVLKKGERLPPQRRLADAADLSLPTITRAYEELERRGLTVGETGRGTFVRDVSEETDGVTPFVQERSTGMIDLSILKPVGDAIHMERMREALIQLAVDMPPAAILGSRLTGVIARHRQGALQWLAHCGVEAEPRNVLITNGATPALTIALMSACPPSSAIATEETGLHVLQALASYHGLKVRGVAIDDDGIIPGALDHACREGDIRALFLLPNALAPTAFVMSADRRHAIVEVARSHNLQIIEDDALGPLIADKPPTLQSLAPERTLYVTSFTKPIMPGLRIGYLVAPERLHLAIANRHLVTHWSATALIAEIATRWVEDGTALELAHWQRRALAERHRIVSKALDDIPHRAHPSSLHVWVPLREDLSEDTIVSHARQQGVAVARGQTFAISTRRPALRISVGSSSADELTRGLRTIRNLLLSEPEPNLSEF